MTGTEVRRGFVAGALAGTCLVAVMYLLDLLIGLHPLPQLLQQPLLDLMPGAVFGFLIDNLQHAGKVVEEAGLIAAMVVALGALGAAYRTVGSGLPHPSLVAAAAGWLVVVGILLPISGDGFLGLAEGPTAPLLWAVLFGIYAVVLEAAADRWLAPLPADADPGRRRVLALTPYVVGGVALAVVGFRLVPGWYQAIFKSPEVGLGGQSPEVTPVGNFYVVSKNFADPVVDAAGWTLNVKGMVSRSLRLDLPALVQLPAVTQYVTLECISNNVGGNQI
ncbi:MAG: molybdopterin-dependent oxidoreductase, partial [Candidatus Dormibacteraeota bacterium]|nr:molybdopterin-dependent oxidoreductase [Candidatus Dormibacteraeota bacterium]